MHREMMNSIGPVILKSIQSCIEAPPEFTRLQNSLEELKLFTALCDFDHNNLMIDEVVQLLVTNTKLVMNPLEFSAIIPPLTDQQSSVSNLTLTIHMEESEESIEQGVVLLDCLPLQQILSFATPYWDGNREDVCVGVQCYKALMELIAAHGASIQKGYNDILKLVISIIFFGLADGDQVRLRSLFHSRTASLSLSLRTVVCGFPPRSCEVSWVQWSRRVSCGPCRWRMCVVTPTCVLKRWIMARSNRSATPISRRSSSH